MLGRYQFSLIHVALVYVIVFRFYLAHRRRILTVNPRIGEGAADGHSLPPPLPRLGAARPDPGQPFHDGHHVEYSLAGHLYAFDAVADTGGVRQIMRSPADVIVVLVRPPADGTVPEVVRVRNRSDGTAEMGRDGFRPFARWRNLAVVIEIFARGVACGYCINDTGGVYICGST